MTVGEPASHGLVEGVAVDAGQDSSQGCLAGHRMVPGQHVERSAQGGSDGLGSVGSPLTDRQERGRAGQYGRGGQREDVDQGVPYPARGSRVGNLGQTFQQARTLGPLHGRLIAQLVKNRGNRGGCGCRHGLPARSRGVETSMILETVPVLHPWPAHPT